MSNIPHPEADDSDHSWIEQQQIRVAQERILELRTLFTNRKNPLYAWQAMAHAFAHKLDIPNWCLEYIRCSAFAIYGLTTQVIGHDFQQEVNATNASRINNLLDPAAAIALLPAALDFPTGAGRNAFSSLRRDIAQQEDAALREMGDSDLFPITAEESVKAIQRRRGLEHGRSVKRRVATGKRLLTGNEVTKPKPT